MQIRPLVGQDAVLLSDFFKSQPPLAHQHFHPFDRIDAEHLGGVLIDARDDHYWMVEHDEIPRAFFMMRGLDVGYPRPAFGVMVDHQCRQCGLGTLALRHSISWARLSQSSDIMLTVKKENQSAIRLYQKHGFIHEKDLPEKDSILMSLNLDQNQR